MPIKLIFSEINLVYMSGAGRFMWKWWCHNYEALKHRHSLNYALCLPVCWMVEWWWWWWWCAKLAAFASHRNDLWDAIGWTTNQHITLHLLYRSILHKRMEFWWLEDITWVKLICVANFLVVLNHRSLTMVGVCQPARVASTVFERK